MPIRNNTTSRNQILPITKPMAAITMMMISVSLRMRISRALSYLSANCPALAENRKNGKMNTPAAAATSIGASSPVFCAIEKVTRKTIAFLKALSLNAPRAWVIISGRKRRPLRRSN